MVVHAILSLVCPYLYSVEADVFLWNCHFRASFRTFIKVESFLRSRHGDNLAVFKGGLILTQAIQSFSKVRLFIGVHGGAFYNLNVAPLSTTIIEFVPAVSEDEDVGAHRVKLSLISSIQYEAVLLFLTFMLIYLHLSTPPSFSQPIHLSGPFSSVRFHALVSSFCSPFSHSCWSIYIASPP